MGKGSQIFVGMLDTFQVDDLIVAVNCDLGGCRTWIQDQYFIFHVGTSLFLVLVSCDQQSKGNTV
jgi:hypothetical protein